MGHHLIVGQAAGKGKKVAQLRQYNLGALSELGGRLGADASTIRGMHRTRHDPYARSTQPAYIVIRDMQHYIIDVQRLEPATNLRGEMSATIEGLAADGWQAEGNADYGFVFIRREGERRLLMLTSRDPYDTARQSFSPFAFTR